jgi:hypothetical protein
MKPCLFCIEWPTLVALRQELTEQPNSKDRATFSPPVQTDIPLRHSETNRDAVFFVAKGPPSTRGDVSLPSTSPSRWTMGCYPLRRGVSWYFSSRYSPCQELTGIGQCSGNTLQARHLVFSHGSRFSNITLFYWRVRPRSPESVHERNANPDSKGHGKLD